MSETDWPACRDCRGNGIWSDMCLTILRPFLFNLAVVEVGETGLTGSELEADSIGEAREESLLDLGVEGRNEKKADSLFKEDFGLSA
jgi:hypothetical protein